LAHGCLEFVRERGFKEVRSMPKMPIKHKIFRYFLPRIRLHLALSTQAYSLKKTILNTLIAMGISGIWHGAAWHFLLWGFYHGLLLVIFRLYRRYFFFPISTPLATIITFISVSLGWLLFIAPLDITLFALKKMFLLYL